MKFTAEFNSAESANRFYETEMKSAGPEDLIQFDDKPGTWQIVSGGAGQSDGNARYFYTFEQVAWWK